MRAPTVVYRTDEILKGIRHCRSSMPVSFHSSTEPGVIGRSFKIFILSQSSFFFSSFLVVASLTRYRHWLSESPLYLHVNETMPYLPYPSEPGLLDFLTRFCFFFFFIFGINQSIDEIEADITRERFPFFDESN